VLSDVKRKATMLFIIDIDTIHELGFEW